MARGVMRITGEGVSRESARKLMEDAMKGNMRALGRLLTLVEDVGLGSAWIIEELARRGRGAHVIGITGMPGSGKSTLVSRMIRGFRRRGHRVAVIAVDPSSPRSMGSLMGDRLRMQEHATDEGVFIRSISTRGLKGGLSLAALSMVEAFDALGYDKIILETVGVGQSEVDVMHAAHTIVVVTMPGAGDDIQALKAGVYEIGDIYVVNKSEKPEAEKTYQYLLFALERGEFSKEAGWRPRVVKTSAILGVGISELVDAVNEHWEHLARTGARESRIRERRVLLLKLLAEKMLLDSLEEVFRSRDLEGKAEELDIIGEATRLAREAARGLGARAWEPRGWRRRWRTAG